MNEQVTNKQQGHLWIGFTYKGKDYCLSYNYGVDVTVIFEETLDKEGYRELKYINYFCGGFNIDTLEPNNDIVGDALYYINNKEDK